MAKNKNKKEFKKELIGILIIGFTFLYIISLLTFSPNDPPNATNGNIHNFIGIFGAYLSYILLFIFGNLAFIVPFFSFYAGINIILDKTKFKTKKVISYIILSFTLSIGAHMNNLYIYKSFKWGGLIPEFLTNKLLLFFGKVGTYIILSLLILTSVILIFDILFKNILEIIARKFRKILSKILKQLKNIISFKFKKNKKVKKTKIKKTKRKNKKKADEKEVQYFQVIPKKRKKKTKKNNNNKKNQIETIKNKEKEQNDYIKNLAKKYNRLPPPKQILNYLKKKNTKENIKEIKYLLEDALDEFGISGKVVNVEKGPMASLYEVEVKKGTKVRKITSLDKDLSLMLSKSNIRIIAPLPQKGTVGFEIPNDNRQFVSLRELLETKEYKKADASLAVAFGKGMNGAPVVVDITELPHLLISGATNSGKSIGIHTIIMSLLYKYTHKEVKLLMIDPKRLEFPYYNEIPHLLTDVIVEPKEAVKILKWALYEMEQRYEKLSLYGYRNIQGYHENENKDDMPYIVIIVDEMADLMMTTSKGVEESIIRLAQMSRAVGIHLILATQRPSVDIITGTIKANFPSRVSYKTATRSNSRIVLDETGAENLLGKGDFLYRSLDGNIIRGQGSLVTVEEINDTVKYLKNIDVEEDEFKEKFEEEKEISVEMDNKDDLYPEALNIVYNNVKRGNEYLSISFLQRKLSIGYNRAARIVESLADDGIVERENVSNKGRPIVIGESQLENLLGKGD